MLCGRILWFVRRGGFEVGECVGVEAGRKSGTVWCESRALRVLMAALRAGGRDWLVAGAAAEPASQRRLTVRRRLKLLLDEGRVSGAGALGGAWDV
jgi:hypothetical protein